VPIHFCDKCGLPIHLYGRMVRMEAELRLEAWPRLTLSLSPQIPCKHVFCYDCALLHEKKGDKLCPG